MKNFLENVFLWRSWRSPEKFLCKPIFFLFFGEHLCLCPRPLALASSIPVLGLESVCPRKGCPWPWPPIFFVSLASSLVSSTPPLLIRDSTLLLSKSLYLQYYTFSFTKRIYFFVRKKAPCKDQTINHFITQR